MPDLDCLYQKVIALEHATANDAKNISELKTLLEKNTELTTQIAQGVTDLIDLAKFFGYLRKAVVWLTPIAAAAAGVYHLFIKK